MMYYGMETRREDAEYVVFSRYHGREVFRGSYEECAEYINRYLEESEEF
jgi:hypothetical protein